MFAIPSARTDQRAWFAGAIAELIDNASDPDVCATHLTIDAENVGRIMEERLIIKDNGNGLFPDQLHRMMR